MKTWKNYLIFKGVYRGTHGLPITKNMIYEHDFEYSEEKFWNNSRYKGNREVKEFNKINFESAFINAVKSILELSNNID